MKGSFRQVLQKEIAQRTGLSAIYVTLILLVLMIVFSLLLQYSQLVKDSQTIVNQTERNLKETSTLLSSINQNISKDYLLGQRTEREVYRYFYEKRVETRVESNLFILDETGDIILSTDTDLAEQMAEDYHLKVLAETATIGRIEPKVMMTSNRKHYLVLVQPVIDAANPIGYTALFISDKDFLSSDEIFSASYLLTDSFGNVFAKNSSLFVTSSLEKLDEQLLAKQTVFTLKNPLLTYQLPIGENLLVHTFQTVIPYGFLLLFSIIVSLFLLGLYLLQLRTLTQKIINYNVAPIDSLVGQMSQISTNDLDKLTLETGDEFEYMAEQINLMLGELDSLHKQKLDLEREKHFFERKMLEAQFNPHFLYNTLETIKITHQLDSELTNELIKRLTSILRYSVSHLEEELNLGTDLDIIQSYLAIHAIRFDGLSYQIDCPQDLLKLAVPKLFLLPLVENALKYGRLYRIDLVINLEVSRENDELIFRVTDNAGGLTKQERQEVLASLDSQHTQHGIVNSYRRLKEYFDEVSLDLGLSKKGETWIEFRVRGVKDV